MAEAGSGPVIFEIKGRQLQFFDPFGIFCGSSSRGLLDPTEGFFLDAADT
jgi:hypothetical protein